jgi:hypothetical protein
MERVMKFSNRDRLADRRKASWLAAALFPVLACAALVSASAIAGQDKEHAGESQPDFNTFVGTWKGTYKGEVFAILILKEQGGKLSGTLNNFDISVDKDGNLDDGTHKDDGDAPLLNVHFKDGALYFIVLEKDQYRSGMNWKFVPLNAQEGELTPVLDHQEDVPKDKVVKPIRILRDRAKP